MNRPYICDRVESSGVSISGRTGEGTLLGRDETGRGGMGESNGGEHG